MGEECGQCINYTTGWLGIPSAPRVPIVRESPRVCSRVIRAYVHYVRACVRACVRVDLQRTYLQQPRNTCPQPTTWAQNYNVIFGVCVIEKVKINQCMRYNETAISIWKIWKGRCVCVCVCVCVYVWEEMNIRKWIKNKILILSIRIRIIEIRTREKVQ